MGSRQGGLKIARMALDFLRLSADYSLAVAWLAYARLMRILHLPLRGRGPFRCGATGTGLGRPGCAPAGRYDSVDVFRLLCPGARLNLEKDLQPYCRQAHMRFEPGLLRMLCIGLVMLAVWGPIALGLRYGLRKGVRKCRQWAAASRTKGRAPTPAGAQVAPVQKPSAVASAPVRPAATAVCPDSAAHAQRADSYFSDALYRTAAAAYRDHVLQSPVVGRIHYGLVAGTLLGPASMAREEYEQAESLDPVTDQGHLELAKIALAAGDPGRALVHARKARDLHPSAPEPHIILGLCYAAQGKRDEARKQAQAAAALSKDAPKTLLELGKLYTALKDWAKAEQCCRRALALDPKQQEARTRLADVLRQQGQRDLAAEQVRAVLRDDPQHARASMQMAELHVDAGDRARAIADYRRIVKRSPGLFAARARLAQLLILSGQTNDGFVVARDLLHDRPGDAAAHLILAGLYDRQGLHALAIEHCRIALISNPNDVAARMLLAANCMASDAYEQAIVDLGKVLELEPKDLDARLLLGEAHRRLRHRAKALVAFETARDRHPDSPLPLIHLGDWYEGEGDFEAAAKLYRNALEMSPHQPDASNMLARLLARRPAGLDEALKLAMGLRTRFPNNPAYAETFGTVCLRRHDYTRAAQALALTVGAKPLRPVPRMRLGLALYGDGQIAEAKEQLETALALSADFEGADRARETLAAIVRRERAKPQAH